MYLGIDFLLDNLKNIYISEVNTGLPGGAREYDLISRTLLKKPSYIFKKIEEISLSQFNKPFKQYIQKLPYYDDIKSLKIWMDGKGPVPKKPFSEYLRLEDKWVQYLLLNKNYPVIPSKLFNQFNCNYLEIHNNNFINKNSSEISLNKEIFINCLKKYASYGDKTWDAFILKRRLGRGGLFSYCRLLR